MDLNFIDLGFRPHATLRKTSGQASHPSTPLRAGFLFRQKGPKPFLPVRGPFDSAQGRPTGNWSTTPNPSTPLRAGQDGSETRSEMQSHLSTQTVFAEMSIRGGGPAAPNSGSFSGIILFFLLESFPCLWLTEGVF